MKPAEFGGAVLAKCRILVCAGCGGAGKTTVAAALALEAARRGRRVLVLTIDPARRLADALGVGALGNEPQSLPREALAAQGVPAEGDLSALMLDMKRTFDDLVERFAESPEARDRILRNPIYQHASDALAGSVEYSAMEKVFELHQREDFDLIVVDTPPAQHALDFLEAPQRLLEFLDSRIVQVLIHPAFAAGRFGFRLFHRSTRRVLRLIERVSGIGFLEDVSEFLLAFEGMAEGFRQRAQQVRALLTGPEASFALVAAPDPESVAQAVDFVDRLEAFGVPLGAVLVNRMRLWPDDGAAEEWARAVDEAEVAALTNALAADAGGDFPARDAARAALDALTGYAALVERDARATRVLRRRIDAQGRFWGEIPEFADDIHDLGGLTRIADSLFGRGPEEPALDRETSAAAERSGGGV